MNPSSSTFFQNLRDLPRELTFLYAGTTITRMGSYVFPFLTIYLTAERGYEKATVGLILSLGSLGLLCGNLLGGTLADLWKPRRTALLALLLNALGFALLGTDLQSPAAYAMFLFLGYTGSGMYTPAAGALIADKTHTEQRAFAFTVNYVCINLGMATGPLVGGLLAAESFVLVFAGDVTTTLICAALLAFFLKEARTHVPRARETDARHPRKSFLTTFREHAFVTSVCLLSFFLIAPLMGLEYSVPLLVQGVHGGALTLVGLIYTINAFCILSFSFVIERALRGSSELHALTLAGLLWTTGIALLVFSGSLFALVACTAIWTLGEIIASIVLPTFVTRHVKSELKGRFLALVDAMRSLAGVLCPLGLGLLWDTRGTEAVLYTLLALPVLGTLGFASLLLRARAQPLAHAADGAAGETHA